MENQANAKRPAALDDIHKKLVLIRPSAWMWLVVLLLITLAVLMASFWIHVPRHVIAQGYEQDGQMICFIDVENVENLEEGQTVVIDRMMHGRVASVSTDVYSRAEAQRNIPVEYTRYLLELPEWGVRVAIDYTGLPTDTSVYMVVITTGEISLGSMFSGVDA